MRTVPFFKSFSVFKGGITSMFIPIDYEQWDRKEIYDAFHGYLYCMTVELIYHGVSQKKFTKITGNSIHPCYCIAKTVNGHQDYRYAKINDQRGYLIRSTRITLCFAQIPTISSPISGLIIARILLHSINNSWKIKPLGKPAKLCTIQRKTT